MTGLIRGEGVTVTREVVARDELGEPTVTAIETEGVEGVLVSPGATSDLDSTRPNGATVAFTLHFPKSYGGDLKDATVNVRGIGCKVVGDPQRYAEGNTPGEWNMTVEVTRTDG